MKYGGTTIERRSFFHTGSDPVYSFPKVYCTAYAKSTVVRIRIQYRYDYPIAL